MEKTIKPTTFNSNDAGLGYMLYVVLSVVVLVVARALIRAGVAYTDLFYYIYAFFVEAIFALAVFLVSSIKGKSMVKASGLNKKVNTSSIILCAVISLICLFGLGRLSDYFIEILSALGYKSSSASVNVKTVGDLLIYTILIAALPAICEELLFRGLILNGLSKYGKNVAIFFSAFAFMIMHGSPEQTVHQFILGIIFGYIVYYTGNLWLTIIIHFCNNFFVLLATFFMNMVYPSAAGSSAGEAISSNQVLALIISYAISVLIVALSVYLVIVSIKRIIKENSAINKVPDHVSDADLKLLKIERQGEEIAPENAELNMEEQANSGGIVVEKIGTPQVRPIIKSRNQEKLDIITIGMFAATTIYLAIEWLLALVEGFHG